MKIRRLSDSEKPSFCWDRDWTVGEIKHRIHAASEPQRLRLYAWILREATFAEVWNFFSPAEIYPVLEELVPWLGKKRDYWRYTFDVWHRLGKIWLERSYRKCKGLDTAQPLDEEQCDDIEALTSRFARASDLFVQKALRAIDAVELEKGGTLLDAAHRAEKRGVVGGFEGIRRIREVRNEISHEYISENPVRLLDQVVSLCCSPRNRYHRSAVNKGSGRDAVRYPSKFRIVSTESI